MEQKQESEIVLVPAEKILADIEEYIQPTPDRIRDEYRHHAMVREQIESIVAFYREQACQPKLRQKMYDFEYKPADLVAGIRGLVTKKRGEVEKVGTQMKAMREKLKTQVYREAREREDET